MAYVRYSWNHGTFKVTTYQTHYQDNDDPLFETTSQNVMTPQNYDFIIILFTHSVTYYYDGSLINTPDPNLTATNVFRLWPVVIGQMTK